MKINKNLYTTTFIHLIVRVIVKLDILLFFWLIFLSCYCLLFLSFYYSFPTILYTANLLFQQLTMVIQFPCKICSKAVASNHHAVQCNKCYIWVQIKCHKGLFHRCCMGQSEANFLLKYVSNTEECFLIVIFGPSIVS